MVQGGTKWQNGYTMVHHSLFDQMSINTSFGRETERVSNRSFNGNVSSLAISLTHSFCAPGAERIGESSSTVTSKRRLARQVSEDFPGSNRA